MFNKEVQLCDGTLQCNRQHLAGSCYLKNYLNETKREMKNQVLYSFIVFGEKNQDTMVNRKFEKYKEIRVKIISLETKHFNREIDDADGRHCLQGVAQDYHTRRTGEP